jgi:hypothetical protein
MVQRPTPADTDTINQMMSDLPTTLALTNMVSKSIDMEHEIDAL